MVGTLRMVGALTLFMLATPFLAAYQALALRLPFLDPLRAPVILHRLMLLLLGISVRVHGAPARERPLLIVSNHISFTDIMVLGGTSELRFIAKKEVAGWPIFGTLARLHQTIFVDRSMRRQVGAQAEAIARGLADGAPLVLFAEGTSSDGAHVLPFKSSLFAAAGLGSADGKAIAIQPVAIAYTRMHGIAMGRRMRDRIAWIGDQTLVPHLVALLRKGAIDAELHFAPPFSAAGMTRKQIAARCEREVRGMLAAALRNPA